MNLDAMDGAQQGSNMVTDPPNPAEFAFDLQHLSNVMGINISPPKPPVSQTSTVQMRIKRPRNQWIIYRSEKSKQLHQSNPNMSAGAISTEVARQWKSEPAEIKQFYADLADIEASEHKIRYPDYRYKPGRQ
uniref:MAT1-1-3 n=1 Tax=Juglanconis oblonga TaxID=1940568 RepID=A0A2P1NR32_9PEZI|nr:MAT1-1-3 [Juglanconis oblonga]AVP71787.1 MAT1-1-3 [Juglanconis oblonga]